MAGSEIGMDREVWEIRNVTDVTSFLRAVLENVDDPVVVSFEIDKAATEAQAVYLRHRSRESYRPWRDTIAPATHVYVCNLSSELINDLSTLPNRIERDRVFWHIKGFVDGKLLFWFHDAESNGSPILSPELDDSAAQAISAAVGRAVVQITVGIDWDVDWRKEPKSEKGRRHRGRSEM